MSSLNNAKKVAVLIASGCLTTEYLETTRWEYNAVTDWRCCDDCLELDGVIFTSEQVKRLFPYAIFTPLLIYPMVHPHCRCAMAILEEPATLQATLPPEVVVSRPGKEPGLLYVEKPLSASDIKKVMKAIRIHSPYEPVADYGLPTGLGEMFKRWKEKRKKQGL